MGRRQTRCLDVFRIAPRDKCVACVVKELRISQSHLPAFGHFHDWTEQASVFEYLKAAGNASFIPATHQEIAALLQAYTLEKALIEVDYELGNRPDWVRIPLNGILDELQ